jgi:hypothetical protein
MCDEDTLRYLVKFRHTAYAGGALLNTLVDDFRIPHKISKNMFTQLTAQSIGEEKFLNDVKVLSYFINSDENLISFEVFSCFMGYNEPN